MVIKKTKGEKGDKLQTAINEINERYGDGAIMKLKNIRPVNIDSISTGSYTLNKALGIGGVPIGRVIEIYGKESSGKTTLALHILREAQNKGKTCAFVDAEHALDPDYAGRIGVNTDNLLISQPGSGEEGLQIVEKLVASGKVGVIVVDSVAALTPQKEIDGDIGAVHVALQARLMSQALRKLSAMVSKTETLIIFINQTRANINTGYGHQNPETTPGGMALKFYASVRVNLKVKGKIMKGEDPIGSRVIAKVVKNKCAAPFHIAEFDVYYNEGIAQSTELINFALKTGTITMTGRTYQYQDKKMGVGMDEARLFIDNNPDIKKEIEKEILK